MLLKLIFSAVVIDFDYADKLPHRLLDQGLSLGVKEPVDLLIDKLLPKQHCRPFAAVSFAAPSAGTSADSVPVLPTVDALQH